MMVIMQANANQEDIDIVVLAIEENQLDAYVIVGDERAVIAVGGDPREIHHERFNVLHGVDRVIAISPPYKLASREFHPQDSLIPIKGLNKEDDQVLIIAGPCSVESKSQLIETALAVKEAGGHALRGGAYKPRTSPYSFQGLGDQGLKILAEAREITGLPVVTEVMSPEGVNIVAEYGFVLQVGARNMQNYSLLRAVGKSKLPVLLKRGMMATIDELLLAAEHILSHGNSRVMICERGIRTFEKSTRFTSDINAIPVLKSRTHLPVLFDPSHSTGHWEYVLPVALAGVAAGADGLLIEVHPHPENALSDGQQSLKPERLYELVSQVNKVAQVIRDESVVLEMGG